MSSSDHYNYAIDPGSEAWAARLLRQVPAGVRVLELGPGPGVMTQILVDRGHEVTVVENDPESVAILRAMGIEVHEGDLNGRDWCDALAGKRFGAILACDVLEHLCQPEAALTALRTFAEPAARLVVSMPNVAYAGLVAALRLGAFDYAEKGLLDHTHMRFFTRSSLARALMTTGWAPELWEGNHVPVELSEFVWHWNQIGDVQRQTLITGWADFDVYQWMTVASPMGDAASSRIRSADEEISGLKERLHGLTIRYDQEHASLVEHQKAFAEAKTAISALEAAVTDKANAMMSLEQGRLAASNELADRDHQLARARTEIEAAVAQLEGLRRQGWPGRVRRLLDALRS